jgi:hypothetical protein
MLWNLGRTIGFQWLDLFVANIMVVCLVMLIGYMGGNSCYNYVVLRRKFWYNENNIFCDRRHILIHVILSYSCASCVKVERSLSTQIPAISLFQWRPPRAWWKDWEILTQQTVETYHQKGQPSDSTSPTRGRWNPRSHFGWTLFLGDGVARHVPIQKDFRSYIVGFFKYRSKDMVEWGDTVLSFYDLNFTALLPPQLCP